MTESAARSVAVQSRTLMPEFPHLALAHVALTLMGDDPDLNNGDLSKFLKWALSVPGISGEWGCTTSWGRYLCPKRYRVDKASYDWSNVRKRFSEADTIIKDVEKELSKPKRMSVFIDASTWGLKAGTPSRRKMKAALSAGNELLSLLDDEGFDVHFHYEADHDGDVQPPIVPTGTKLYLPLRTILSMGRTACLSTPDYGETPVPHWEPRVVDCLLDSMREGGFQVIEGSREKVANGALFNYTALLNIAVDFPIGPRAGEGDVQAWAAEFAAILTRGLIAADDAIRQNGE